MGKKKNKKKVEIETAADSRISDEDFDDDANFVGWEPHDLFFVGCAFLAAFTTICAIGAVFNGDDVLAFRLMCITLGAMIVSAAAKGMR